MRFHVAIMISALLISTSAMAETCSFDAQKKVLAKTANGSTVAWILEEQPALYETYSGQSQDYKSYFAWVRQKTSWSAREALENHQKLSLKYRAEVDNHNQQAAKFIADLDADIFNGRLILSGTLGSLRGISCLEALPFIEFLHVVDLRKSPAEMNVQILKSNGQVKVIGDFYRASSVIGVENSAALDKELALSRKTGWKPFAHLHNHPWMFDSGSDDVGGIGPSLPDIASYRKTKIPMALITDGIETFSLRKEEISQLKTNYR